MTYSEIISKTTEVYVACDIHSFPVNCVEIIESYGYKVYTYSYIKALYPRLYDYCRNYSTDSFKHTGLGCVMYNDACNQGRILFSLAHEIGHIALGHVGEVPEFEDAADSFAGYLLAPCIMIDHYHCQTFNDVMNHFGLSTAAANIAWQNYRRWKRHAPCTSDIDLLNWILYLRRPIEITEDNMYQVNPFESLDMSVYAAISDTTNQIGYDASSEHAGKTVSSEPMTDCSVASVSHTVQDTCNMSVSVTPPLPLANVSPFPQKDWTKAEKMRRYHRKRRIAIEKELEQVRQDMDRLHRMDADFLGAAEDCWLYSD